MGRVLGKVREGVIVMGKERKVMGGRESDGKMKG